MHNTDTSPRVIAVIGRSGAGRNTALTALEDFGFHRIDNLPSEFLPKLLNEMHQTRSIAMGFNYTGPQDFANLSAALIKLHDLGKVELVFLTADDDVLIRRYSETRRRHPVAPLDGGLIEAMREEVQAISPLAARADILIDTSRLTPHELKAELKRHMGLEAGIPLTIRLRSFAYKRGLPRDSDFVFDCRFLTNPHWQPDLRAKDGRNQDVRDFVMQDPGFASYFNRVSGLITDMLPALRKEGRSYFTVSFGCNGGRHRSVTLVEALSAHLQKLDIPHEINHREVGHE